MTEKGWSKSIDLERIPKHIAVIMDGNGRWAARQGEERSFGHKSASKAVEDVIAGCREIGVSYLTLYAFSTENWQRPKEEVDILMHLLITSVEENLEKFFAHEIKFCCIGNLSLLPCETRTVLESACTRTVHHRGLTVCLALNYSGRAEIVRASQSIAQAVADQKCKPGDIDEKFFTSHLYTASMPDPELLIRTSGEMRISNFLLWQIAYTELYITEILWPDFRKEHLGEALLAYQDRERRFGQTSAQISL